MMASVTSKSLLSLPAMTTNLSKHSEPHLVISKNGVIDRIDETYDEFLENEEVQAKVKALWAH